MIRISRVFLAFCLAMPVFAQPPEIRNEKGETAFLRYVLIPKPDVNGYFTAYFSVNTTVINNVAQRFIDMVVTEGSYDYPYRTKWVTIHSLLPADALSLAGNNAVFEYDFTGKPDVFVDGYEYDATGYITQIPYQPGHMRVTFAKNGLESFSNTGSVVGNQYNLEIRFSGHWTNNSADVAGTIFGNAFSGANNGGLGTRHTNTLHRTRIEGPVLPPSGAPPAGSP